MGSRENSLKDRTPLAHSDDGSATLLCHNHEQGDKETMSATVTLTTIGERSVLFAGVACPVLQPAPLPGDQPTGRSEHVAPQGGLSSRILPHWGGGAREQTSWARSEARSRRAQERRRGQPLGHKRHMSRRANGATRRPPAGRARQRGRVRLRCGPQAFGPVSLNGARQGKVTRASLPAPQVMLLRWLVPGESCPARFGAPR